MLVLKESRHSLPVCHDPLQQEYAKMSNDERNVLGSEALSLKNDDCIPMIDTMRSEGTLRIYGDGSVKDGRGSHAYRIRASPAEDASYIESSAVSSGDKRWITSLRTETLSMLGAFYLVRCIAAANGVKNKNFTVEFTYDNEESVRRLNLLKDFYSSADPLATDYDVWAEMKNVHAELPNALAKAAWVKGHQDDVTEETELSFEAKENIAMDRKCEEMRESTNPIPPFPYFSSEAAQVVKEGTPITQQLKEFLHVETTGPALRKYICKKNNWTEEQFEMINWQAYEKYLNQLPGAKRTNVLKMQHGWIFTAERDHLFKSGQDDTYETRTASPCCPFNCQEVDYKWHFLTCANSPLAPKVTAELKQLLSSMRSLQTDPNLRSVIMNRLRTTLKGLPPKQITLPAQACPVIRQALEEQDSIGWDHFLLGQTSRKWEEAQSLWYRKLKKEKAKVEKHLTGIFWARKIIANTVYLTLNRWQLHNDYLHNISRVETYTKERGTYLQKIQSIMDRRHTLPNDSRLRQFFTGEIRNAQTLPLARLKEWHKGYESLMEIISPQLITQYMATTFSPPLPG
ncbi:hypothetical protein CTEN210_07038 [Chaetoceros tenuissimus]|uniref:RNase H type-1 domain-containing protein n=1 Tax=Chaetoceros tenuissimus TaxID=426638 RepID=A0AAD3CQZ2_9STRA|nr:hypothetical protein CTEN210_07038 [Chaetoceros tenuissimus]